MENNLKMRSVADQGCLIRIPNPDFYPFRIWVPGRSEPTTATKEEGGKIFLVFL
jgi:hypothetical protein